MTTTVMHTRLRMRKRGRRNEEEGADDGIDGDDFWDSDPTS